MYKVQQHSCCNATEISEREYLRLALKEPPDNRFALFQAERERLKKVSSDKASKWPNTLVNLRLLREQARLDRIKKEEEDMIKRDRENVGVRHKERLDKIDKANHLLERPHIKALQSKAWINDVMKERIEQLKLAKIWKDKWVEQEKYYHNEMLKTVAKLNQEEEDKVKKAYEMSQQLIKIQNEQIAEIRKQEAKEEEEKILEKERLKKQFDEEEAKEKAKEERRKEIFLANIKEVTEANKSNKGKGAMLGEMKQKLEEDIAIYWKKRKAWEADLKKTHDEKKTLVKIRQDIMSDKLDKLYKEKAIKIAGDEERHRIAREKAEDEAFAAKEAKAKALLEECHKSRRNQIARKKELLEEEKKDIAFEDKHAAENIKKAIDIEKQEEIARYTRNRKIAAFLINQKKQKEEKTRLEKETQLHEDIEALIQLKADEEYLKNITFDD